MKAKKILLLTLLFTLILSVIPSVLGEITFNYYCYDKDCKEGTRVDYVIGVVNTLNETLIFDKLVLKNDELNVIVDSYIGKAVTLLPYETYLFNLTTEVKVIPPNTYTLNIRPCFMEVKLKNKDGNYNVYAFCDVNERNIPILPLSKINCNTSEECAFNETCFFYDCKNVQCNENETVFNHTCIASKQTKSSCGFFEQKTEALSCMPNQAKIIGFLLIGLLVIVSLYYIVKASSAKKAVKTQSRKKKK